MAIIISKGNKKPVSVSGTRTVPVRVQPPTGGKVAWGKIVGDINAQEDLMALISGIPEEEKEILSVLSAGSSAPETAVADDLYINTDSNKLYKYTSGAWTETEAIGDVIYIAEDTLHAYVYRNGVFNDITGTQVDDVIYISSMSDLDSYTTKGMYKIYAPFYIFGGGDLSSGISSFGSLNKDYYTFIVNAQLGMRTQIVHNNTGYATRSKSGSSAWGAWRVVEYASTEYVKDVYDIACAGLIL